MKYQQMQDGRLQLNLSDTASRSELERWTAIICRHWNARIMERIDGLDQSYWDIEIDGRIITLHWENYLGICLFAAEKAADEIIRVMGNALAANGAITEMTDD